MQLICPDCQTAIDAENVNVATDIAKCTICNELYKASDLMADVDLSENLKPPLGSKIVFESDTSDRGSILLPKRGLKGKDAFSLVFSIFWICFIAFWTWGAAQANLLFAAFSIPFWFVGIAMWRGILIGITETQTIIIEPDTLSITKKSIVSSKVNTIPYLDMESIELGHFTPHDPFTAARYMRHFTQFSGMAGGISLPTISHGTQKTRFAESVSEAEMKWLINVLKVFVFKKTGKRV